MKKSGNAGDRNDGLSRNGVRSSGPYSDAYNSNGYTGSPAGQAYPPYDRTQYSVQQSMGTQMQYPVYGQDRTSMQAAPQEQARLHRSPSAPAASYTQPSGYNRAQPVMPTAPSAQPYMNNRVPSGYGYAPVQPSTYTQPAAYSPVSAQTSATPSAYTQQTTAVPETAETTDSSYGGGYTSSYRAKTAKKKKKGQIIAAAVIVAVLGITAVIAFMVGAFDKRYQITLADGTVVKMTQKELIADMTTDVFPEGVIINGINVSGMTKEEALSSIKANQPERPLEIDVRLLLDGKEYPLDLSALPIEVNDVEVVDKAFNYLRPTGEETVEELIAMHDAREALKATPVTYQTAYTPNTADISTQVHGVLDSLDHEAVDAVITGFDVQTCEFEYTPSEQGYDIDIDAAVNAVKDLLDGGTYVGTVDVDAEVIDPYLTSYMIENEFGLISSTSSSTSSSNANRCNNVATAASSINGTIIQNGGSFSFNGTVGERTAANGYMEAGVIVEGATEQGYGGGVCQVSTMVYESAVKADLQIDERHPHQWPARYADDGCDAAVDWGSQDLVFTNTSGYPIVISAYHDDYSRTITVAIYGHQLPDGEYIRFTGDSEVTVEYQTTYVQNTELPVGERNTTREGHDGITAHSYKVRYDAGGNEIGRTEYTTYYNVINAEEEVGTLQADGTQAAFDATTGEVTTTESTTTDDDLLESDSDWEDDDWDYDWETSDSDEFQDDSWNTLP